MASGVDALGEFLLAAIAEDEERFKWGCPGDGEYALCAEMSEYVERSLAAMQQIVELHRVTEHDTYRGGPCCSRCTAGGEYPADDAYTDEQNWPCPTLRALAAVYADHPGYREEWKP